MDELRLVAERYFAGNWCATYRQLEALKYEARLRGYFQKMGRNKDVMLRYV